jgi:steroid 5-alpha reductase family enzyme
MGHSSTVKPHPGGRRYLYTLNLVAYTLALLPGFLLSSRFADATILTCPEWSFTSPTSQAFPLYYSFVSNLAATMVIFAFSVIWQNSSMFDAYWSLAPPVYLLYFTGLAAIDYRLVVTRALLVGFVIGLWALRLTVNCFQRWDGLHQEDWRYALFRKFGTAAYWFVSLTGFHLFPSLLVFSGCVSVFVTLLVGTAEVGLLDGVALILGLIAVGFEYFADTQMNEFVKQKEKGLQKDEILRTGLWSISR